MPLTLPAVGMSNVGATPNLAPPAIQQVGIVPTQPPLQYNQYLPERTNLVLQGNSYGCILATGLTSVALQPTTLSDLAIFNGEPIGGAGSSEPGAVGGGPGKTYIIDRVFGFLNAAAAAVTQLSLVGQIIPAQPLEAGPSDVTSILRWSLSGRRSTYTGKAALVTNVTTQPTAVANKWFILGSSAASGGAASIGTAVEANCYGRYLIPPGAYFSLTGIVGTAVASSMFVGFEWHEVQLPLPA